MADWRTDPLTPLLKAIAARVGTVPGVKSAAYPAVNQITARTAPAAIVFPGSPNAESVLMRNTGGQVIWEPAVTIQLLTPREGSTQKEFAAVDRLIVPVVDAFDVSAHVSLPGLGFHVDHCLVKDYRAAVNVEYAGHVHYGAEFYLSIKFRRAAGA